MNNDNYNEQEDQKQSKYNSALSQLYRLDNLWQQAHAFSTQGQFNSWNWVLDSVWRELGADASPEQEREFYKSCLMISKYKKNRNVLYMLLQKKELVLRKMQNSLGMGVSYAETTEDYMNQ